MGGDGEVRSCLLLKELGLHRRFSRALEKLDLRRRSLLLKELECTFFRLVTRLVQLVNRLYPQKMLLAADDAPLVLHQILRGQATARVLGRAVVDLRLAAHRNLRRLARLTSVLAAEHFLTRVKEFVREMIVLCGGHPRSRRQTASQRSYEA